MREITIIIEKGNLGKDSMRVDIKGIQLPKHSMQIVVGGMNKPIGSAHPFIEDGMLKCKLNLLTDELGYMYPYIGFKSIKTNGSVITKSKLIMVGLSSNKNFDETIKSIGEQSNDKKES